ncbi:hypothetical protein CTEN210_17268 [Chaetoceros tenuissimus]|uniref:Protein Mpv17 n=1 Tax=Chaetoceros tenuissimus TaxID=426638 RepID=A0AAD3DA83_9STRA|nr:hypothetical protein CTEN210_17268 [Chaetoceros tenuissimus]
MVLFAITLISFLHACYGFQQGNRLMASAFHVSSEGTRKLPTIQETATSVEVDRQEQIETCEMESIKEHEEEKTESCRNENIAIADLTPEFSINIETTFHTNEELVSRSKEDVSSEKGRNRNHLSATKDKLQSYASLYNHFLEKHELLTKTLTSGSVGMIGDIMAQAFEHRLRVSKGKFILDVPRILGIFFECACLSAPVMHYSYDFLERVVPVQDDDFRSTEAFQKLNEQEKNIYSLKQWAAASFHVLADIFLLGPLYVLNIMFAASLFEGRIGSFALDMRSNFMPTLKTSVIASLGFMPLQIVAFKMLPTRFRLLYINFQDIIWSALVSFAAHKSHR